MCVPNCLPQEQLSLLVERKEQLKEDLAASQEEVDQWKSKFRSHDQHMIHVCMSNP